MTTFWLACAALVLFSGVFYLRPGKVRQRPLDDTREANLEWYRLRQRELSESGEQDLEADAQLRLLEDAPEANERAPLRGQRRFPAWLLLPLVALLSAALYYQLGGAADVQIAERLQALDEHTEEADLQALMAHIEARAEQRPENIHYRSLLGRFHMGRGNYRAAAAHYDQLLEAAPEDPQALAYAAQARYLAAGRELDSRAQAMAEQALSINPHQRTALGLLGMVSFEREQYRAAIQYWERLLAMEAPGSEGADMIAGVIDQARRALGEPPAEAGAPLAADGGAGVTVAVSLPPGAELDPRDTVFVLARKAESDSRMPIAVQRLQAGQLPMTLRLDDSSSMAGQKLSEAESVVVVVQVSPDGTPGEASATWLGRAGPLSPSLSEEALPVVLEPRPG